MEPISKVNLERITNGIYAFTMTLMVRNIQSPQQNAVLSDAAISTYVGTTVLSIVDFIGAFLILGMFWLFYFQMFHRMRTVDFRFVHVHLLSLMVVVFVPFTQSFLDEQLGIPVSAVLFQVNYFFLSVLLIWQWHYVRSMPALQNPPFSQAEAAFISRKYRVPLLVSAFGIAIVIAGLPYIDLLYLLPFVILGIFFHSPPEERLQGPGTAAAAASVPVEDAETEAVPEGAAEKKE